MTIAEKWQLWLNQELSYYSKPELSDTPPFQTDPDSLYINGALCPDDSLINEITHLSPNVALVSEQGELLAIKATDPQFQVDHWESSRRKTYQTPFTLIRNVWEIFQFNGAQIKIDFQKITQGRKSEAITDPYTAVYNQEDIFIEQGAKIKAAMLNAENGPIYIGKDAVIQEGSSIQGPFAIGTGSTLAQGTKIRPNTTIGPYSKVGGEVSNVVIFGFSNKGHDGYLGNAVLGEWCNLGANTNASNLKNDHGIVKLYSYSTHSLEPTGLVFCGLIMGDYSKAGISTMFNTGTVVGVGVNVYGHGFQPKHIPSFCWGGSADGFTEYRLDKALFVIKDTYQRRNQTFGSAEEALLHRLFENTKTQRQSFILELDKTHN